MKKLDLRFNPIKNIPMSIFDLKELNELDLYQCNITEMPESIQKLEKLTKLNLGFNPINNIPISLFDLKELNQLDLANCKITEVP